MSEVGGAIRIDGLDAYVRNLRKLNNDVPKALRVAFNEAADIVITAAKPGVPRRSGKAVGSIKARSTRTSVRVVEGGNRAPYMPWLDFGGKTGRLKRTKRPFIKGGRYLYPALAEKTDEITAALQDALIQAARDAGIEVD